MPFFRTGEAGLRCKGEPTVTNREIYVGGGLSAIDAKGRVAIPAQLRGLILENSGGAPEIGLVRSRSAPCLTGFDKPYIKRIPETLERDYAERKDPSITREFLARQAFATIETVPFDTSGRFIISPLMRRLGKLEDLAYFSGAGDYIEIWNPTHAMESDLVPEEAKIALEFFLEQRGVK